MSSDNTLQRINNGLDEAVAFMNKSFNPAQSTNDNMFANTGSIAHSKALDENPMPFEQQVEENEQDVRPAWAMWSKWHRKDSEGTIPFLTRLSEEVRGHRLEGILRSPRHSALTAMPRANRTEEDRIESRSRKEYVRKSANSTLWELLRNPCIADSCASLTIYHGCKRPRKRLDVPIESIQRGVSCGNDHILFCGAGGKVMGIGNSVQRQLRNNYVNKPYLLQFSKPVVVDIERDEVPPPQKAKYELDTRINKTISEEEAAERRKFKFRDEPDCFQQTPATAFCASGSYSCVATGATVFWSKMAKIVLELPKKVTQIGAGTQHVVLLCSDRKCYGFGDNSKGQLGYFVSLKPPSKPVKKNKSSNIKNEKHNEDMDETHKEKKRSADEDGKEDEEENEEKELPRETRHPVLLATSVTCVAAAYDLTLLARKSKVWSISDDSFMHFFDEPILELVCGRAHALALLSNSRKIFAWGSNNHGALGISSSTKPVGGFYDEPQLINGRLGPFWHKVCRVEQIAAGEFHSLLRTAEGTVYAWGRIAKGEIALRPQKLDFVKNVQNIAAGPCYAVFVECG